MVQYNIKQQEKISEDEILDYMVEEDTFMDFGEGLRRIIRKKMPPDYPKDEKNYLNEKAKQHGIKFHHNTVKNWFDGTAPKKGDMDRKRMFMICFALELNLEETEEFFRKVYYDRAINYRNYEEFIYYCCIKNQFSYEHAEMLVGCAKMSMRQDSLEEEADAHTVYTRMMQQEADDLSTDEAILAYVKRERHNFDIKNKTAKELLEKLLYQVKGREEEKERLDHSNTKRIDRSCSFIARECSKNVGMWKKLKDIKTKKSFASIATMVDIIYGIDMGREVFFIKDAKLPEEIKTNIPLAHTFRKADPSSDELRKMMILLYSYKFWVVKVYENPEVDFSDYEAGLNDLLYTAYLPTLYIGNPYDWLFMYCTQTDNPLNTFRYIILGEYDSENCIL